MRVSGRQAKIVSLVWGLFLVALLAGCGGGGTPNPTPTPAPPPAITSVSPTAVTAGGPSFLLTVNGANFVSSSVVQWNGGARATTVVSPTQLQATITSVDMAAGASNTVTVANPAGLGGVSAGFGLTVNNPVPAISKLSPAALAACGPAFTLTVTGSNFV